MSDTENIHLNEVTPMQETAVNEKVWEVLENYAPYLMFETDMRFSRVQGHSHQDPIRYNSDAKSMTRYAHLHRTIGVGYVACSDELALLETFQQGKAGPGTPVLKSEIDSQAMVHSRPTRPLKLVDVGELTRRLGLRPGTLTEPKGDGKGYLLPQQVSTACSEYSDEIDGLVYPSAVYYNGDVPAKTRNLVLFEGRGKQLVKTDSTPLAQLQLHNGETVYEFLEGYQVDLELEQ